MTGGDYDEISKGQTCYPFQLPWCSHHEPGKYPNCPSQEYNTPACPADNGKGCSESTYPKTWAADKIKAKTSYNIDSVASMQADLMAHGSISVAFTVYK